MEDDGQLVEGLYVFVFLIDGLGSVIVLFPFSSNIEITYIPSAAIYENIFDVIFLTTAYQWK